VVTCIHCGSEVLPVKPRFSPIKFLNGIVLAALVGLLAALVVMPLLIPVLVPAFACVWGLRYYVDLAVKQPVFCPKCGKNAYKRHRKWKGLLRGGWNEE